MKQTERILIVVAMEAEAMPAVERLGLTAAGALSPRLPMKAYMGGVRGFEIMLVVNGRDARFDVDNVATQPASLAAYAAIERFAPDLIINAGTAGAIKKEDLAVADTVVAKGPISFHDRRIPLQGFDSYGVGAYPCADASSLARDLGMKQARISTGNSLDMTATDFEMIKNNKAAVKDMEGAAVAWVAWIMEVPFMALKTVSDYIDAPEGTPAQFQRNLEKATVNLASSLERVLAWLDENGPLTD